MRRILWGLLGVLAALAFAIVVVGLIPRSNDFPLFFFFTGFRSFLLFVVAAGVSLLVAVLYCWSNVRKRLQLKRGYLITALLLVVSLLGGSVVTLSGARVVSISDIPAPEDGTLRILSWNTDATVPEQDIIELAEKTRPDIIALPEEEQGFTSSFDCNFIPKKITDHVGRLCAIGRELDMSVYFREDASEQTLFISNKLGRYEPEITPETPPSAGFLAKPVDTASGSPDIMVVHLQRPEFGFGTSWWNLHVAWARSACLSPNTIAIGDFNATNAIMGNMGSVDLGACRDIATRLGQNPTGTWPTALPAFWGAPIDHVYIGSGLTPLWFGTLPGSMGTQHRPIFAIIRSTAGRT